MVLYSTVTTYHLLEAIIHKVGYNKEENSVLMISHWLAEKYEWYEQMQAFFDKVIVFYANYQYSESIVEQLNDYFTTIFEKNRIDIKTINQIHVFGAEHSFGAYVFCNELENYYWEEGAGALSKKDSMLKIFQKAYGKEKAYFQYEMHLGDGETPFVHSRFYDKHYQLKEVEGENLIHFDIAEELESIEETDRNQIIKLFYGTEKIKSDPSYALILTEHMANLSTMTWEEQLTMYKYFVDYFLQDYKLLFKPHPDDTMYYEYEFFESSVIRKRFPAELLPYIFEEKPGVVATSSSTSIYGLRSQFDKVMEFNFDFSHNKQFFKLNRFFVGLSIADQYIKKGYQLNLLGVNSPIVDNFYRFQNLCTCTYKNIGDSVDNVTESELRNHTVWVIDELLFPHKEAKKVCAMLSSMPEDNIVIFINSDESYCFYDFYEKELWENLFPVEVNIMSLPEVDHSVSFAGPSVNEDRKEMIYIFQKGAKPNMYEIKRELPNVGVSVTANDFDGDKMQIKLLEGMLAATEKRLLYYIEREKELLKEKES